MSNSPVDLFLASSNRWDRWFSLTTMLLSGFVLSVMMLVGLLGLDAILSLPAWFRFAIDVSLVVLLLIGMLALWRRWRLSRFHPQRVARKLEQTLGVADNSLVNAVDLEQLSQAATSAALRASAIEQAQQMVGQRSALEIVNFGLVTRRLLSAMGVFLLACGGWWLAPKLVERVLPRFLNPFGDHPPYSLLQFEVRILPDRLLEGESARIEADLNGAWLPSTAVLTMVNDAGQKLFSLPMSFDAKDRCVIELNKLQTDFQFRIQTEQGDSDLFQVKVWPRPRLKSVKANFVYPPYTHLESVTKVQDGRPIRAVAGTQLTLLAETDLPLESGTIRYESSEPDTRMMQISEPTPNLAQDQCLLQDQKRVTIALLSKDQVPLAKDWQAKIEVLPDQPPLIRIQSPEPYSIAVEGWKVPIEIEASDDIELDQVQLLTRTGAQEFEITQTSSAMSDSPRRQSLSLNHELDLEQLGAKSGDVIEYFASATDHYPADLADADDHLSKTGIHLIRVISLDEYQELARQELQMEEYVEELAEIQQQLQELQAKREEILQELEELQEKLLSGAELSPAELSRLENLQNLLRDFEASTQALADRLNERAEQPPLYDFEEPMQKQLKQLADQLSKQAQQSKQIAQALADRSTQTSEGKALDSDALEQAAEEFKQNNQPFGERSELSEMEQDLKQLAKAAEFMELSMQMQSIVQQQRQIADELTEFREPKEWTAEQERRLQKLGKAQDMLRQELNETLDRMDETADRYEADFPKGAHSLREMVQQIDEMKVLDDQRESAQAAFEQSGALAQSSAELAAQKLESLTCDSCNGESMCEQLGNCDSPFQIPKEKLQNSLRQLAQAMQPGAGQKPGQGRGQGSGRSGRGFGQGGMSADGSSGNFGQGRLMRSQSFRQPGQTGSLFGPQQQKMARSRSRSKAQRGNGAELNSIEHSDTPELLNPESAGQLGQVPNSLNGVPTPYLEHARAYMKRLNEEPGNQTMEKE